MKTKITNSKRLDILGNRSLLSNRENLTALLKRFRQKLGYYSMFATFPAILTSVAQEAQAEEGKKPEMLAAGQNVQLLERLNKNRSKPELLRSLSNYRLPFETVIDNTISQLAGSDDCPGSPIPGGTYTADAPFTDSGDTTGANNTVQSICAPYYCYSYAGVSGPDQIYSFTLTGLGANPQIQVTATSANYYPAIYILEGNLPPGCPNGTYNDVTNNFNSLIYPPENGTVTIGLTSAPLNVPLHLFIDSTFPEAGGFGSGSYTIRLQDVTIAGPTAATASVSGRVITTCGKPVENATITMIDSQGNERTATTTSLGYYYFENVMVGETIILTVTAKNYYFSQPSRVISVNGDLTDVDFVAEQYSMSK